MQEAIELVKKYDNREIPFNVMFFNLELLLEKEKEDLMLAFNDGKVNSVLNKINSTEYYNKNYNQNK